MHAHRKAVFERVRRVNKRVDAAMRWMGYIFNTYTCIIYFRLGVHLWFAYLVWNLRAALSISLPPRSAVLLQLKRWG